MKKIMILSATMLMAASLLTACQDGGYGDMDNVTP